MIGHYKTFKKSAKPFAVSLLLSALVTGCATYSAQQSPILDINLVGRAVLNHHGSPEGAAEIVQYHKASNRIYAINSSSDTPTVEILELASLKPDTLIKNAQGVMTNTNLDVATTLNLSKHTLGDANSIAISEPLNLLAVAMAAKAVGQHGYIAFYDISKSTPSFIKNVAVGYLPDMVAFSPNGNKVIVANEGEPSGDYLTDPEGSISIIDINNGVIANTATALNFHHYDDKQAELEAQGVVFANPTGKTIKGTKINTTVSMDLEPEYVAVTADSKMAYVSLQENNAMAVVDLTNNRLVTIMGLGFKDWGKLNFDASDKDGGMHFQQYQHLYGMYQPDTIASYRWHQQDYIVTANEGDGREYFFDSENKQSCFSEGGVDYDEKNGCLSYSDEIRAKKLTLDPINFANIKNNNDDLGRLKVSAVKGDIDHDGDFDQLYTYGGRSFTIWDNNGQVVFDSGDEIALVTAQIHGEAFNNDEDENKGDTRSDAKGAEPEALALGKINDRTYAFIGLERMSGIMVYDITNPSKAHFVDYFYNRGTVEGEKVTGDLAPEGMAFIAATKATPARLLVGNEISGSIAVWEISIK